jgi:hypothetical protein
MEAQPAANLDPNALVHAAPEDEYALLELRLDWPYDLEIYPTTLSLWLRLFVITQDPLSWIADRGEAWATATADDDVLEVDVYLLLDLVRRRMADNDDDVAAAIGPYAAAAMQASLTHEHVLVTGGHPDLAVVGDVPRLLDDLDGDHGAFGTPAVQVRQSWAPLGLGALQDLVQDAFGSIDLDRSRVRLDPVDPPTPDCAACNGEGFGFPSALEEVRESLCARHQAAARGVNAERLARARESNPAGWRAIDKAAMRINKLTEPAFAPQPPRLVATPARNDPCPCGSGRKYKRCHGA